MIKTLEKVKWGFIGCGEVTEKKSGPAFSMIRNSEVVAVMSRKAEKAESYAQRHHIPRWYTDAQLLIGDEDVNAIYIATPPSSHATFAIMAMKAGKPVYIEKPMAASYEDCARINRISKETGVPCFVAYYRRYLPLQLREGEALAYNMARDKMLRDIDKLRSALPKVKMPDELAEGELQMTKSAFERLMLYTREHRDGLDLAQVSELAQRFRVI